MILVCLGIYVCLNDQYFTVISMAALSAIAAYDVSDAESDEEANENQTKTKSVDTLDPPSDHNNKIEKATPVESVDDTDNIVEEESGEVDSNNSLNDNDGGDDDDDDAISIHDNIIMDDEDETSMIISEEEKETTEVLDISEPAKLKFKRYSCDNATALAVKLKNMTDKELHLPPEPEGRCSNQLQDKIKKLYEKKIKEGENLNQKIQERKDFRNPSIYDKLILYLGIEERGTNFSKSDFDPSFWRKVPDYENLARAQREDVAKREREKKTKVEFVTGTVKKPSSTSNVENAKKTKWDAPSDDRNLKSNSAGSNSSKTIISALGPVKKTKS